MIVHAGSPEPVRRPEPIYSPVRKQRTSAAASADVSKTARRKETSQVSRNDGDRTDYTPTAIPADVLAMIDTSIAERPSLNTAPAGTRNVSLPIPLDEGLPGPPEPPPGDLDVRPPVVIGGHVEPAVLIEQTKPVYPAVARNARVEGIVVLEGTISTEGKVEGVHVVSGHPMLLGAAVKAIEKWKYRPAKLNGQFIACPVRIQVRFTLQYPGD